MTADAPVPDLATFDYDRPLFGIEDIRALNPHRYEFEMLSGIVHVDPSRHLIIGFKDARSDEFWTRGHMPNFPLFPGVLMCEAAAQMCAFYYTHQKVGTPGVLLGLAFIDGARFLRPVRPGERLVIVGTGVKVHRRLTRFQVVGYVGGEKTFEAEVGGTPLGLLEDLRGA